MFWVRTVLSEVQSLLLTYTWSAGSIRPCYQGLKVSTYHKKCDCLQEHLHHCETTDKFFSLSLSVNKALSRLLMKELLRACLLYHELTFKWNGVEEMIQVLYNKSDIFNLWKVVNTVLVHCNATQNLLNYMMHKKTFRTRSFYSTVSDWIVQFCL